MGVGFLVGAWRGVGGGCVVVVLWCFGYFVWLFVCLAVCFRGGGGDFWFFCYIDVTDGYLNALRCV